MAKPFIESGGLPLKCLPVIKWETLNAVLYDHISNDRFESPPNLIIGRDALSLLLPTYFPLATGIPLPQPVTYGKPGINDVEFGASTIGGGT